MRGTKIAGGVIGILASVGNAIIAVVFGILVSALAGLGEAASGNVGTISADTMVIFGVVSASMSAVTLVGAGLGFRWRAVGAIFMAIGIAVSGVFTGLFMALLKGQITAIFPIVAVAAYAISFVLFLIPGKKAVVEDLPLEEAQE